MGIGLFAWAVVAAAAPRFVATREDAWGACRSWAARPPAPPASRDPVATADAEAAWPERREAALAEPYEVVIPARHVRIARYDRGRGQLVLDGRFSFPGAGGGLLVRLDGDGALRFTASAEQARRAFRLTRAHRLLLDVVFHPGEEGCSGAVGARSFAVVARPGWATLRSDGGTFSLAGAADWEPPSGSAALHGLPPVIEGGEADLARVAGALEGDPDLRRCGSNALDRRPDASGAVVFHADVGDGGRIARATLALDAVGDAALVRCLGGRLGSMVLPGVSAGSRLYLPIEITGR